MPPRKITIDPSAEQIGDPKSEGISLSEVGREDGGVTLETDFNLSGRAAEEQFFNEVLKIEVHASDREGDLDYVAPTVNGITQYIVRGTPQMVKRKYVAVLARARQVTYQTRVTDPSKPDSIKMVPREVLSYPFTVIHDPNPGGAEWLRGILRTKA